MFGEIKMKTEAQKMRELLESLLKAGPISLEEIYDAEPKREGKEFHMPDQRATYDQLLTLLDLGTQNGLYDATDWLRGELSKMRTNFK